MIPFPIQTKPYLAAEFAILSRLRHDDSTPVIVDQIPMPQKRRHRRPLQEGLSRRRLDEDGASLSESLVDSDSSSRVDGGSPPPGFPDDELVMSSTEPRYHQIITSRLAQLQLPDSADISDLDGCSNLPSSEILEALTPKSFHDDDLRAALLEYQCQNLLSEIRGPDFMGLDTEDSGESEPDDLTRDEKFTRAREVLVARMPDIDTYTRLDQEQTNKVYFKHALYRIRAALVSLSPISMLLSVYYNLSYNIYT
jgi:hypothetical protein